MTQRNVEASPEPVPDLLRRLERELAPLADSASSLERRTVGRSVILRVSERLAIAAAVLLSIGSIWILSEQWQRPTTAVPTADQSAVAAQRELEQLRQTLSIVEAERDKLRQEREAERRQYPAISSWHEDLVGLNYRSPWQQ
jgi:hypothetical protein